MADEPRVETAERDGVLELILTNPANRNSLLPDMSRFITAELRRAAETPSIGAVLLAGHGNTFCSGGNVKALSEQQSRSRASQTDRIAVLNELVRAMRACPRPIVVAVEGAAAGVGFSLALAGDFIVAARDARFLMAYVRLGLSPDGGGSWFLGRALPHQLAAEILMAGEPVGAERLHAAGVVNRVTEPGRAVDEARALAQKLAQGATAAIARDKRLLAESATATLEAQLERERDFFVDSLHAPEAHEGVPAFLEKRPARFPK